MKVSTWAEYADRLRSTRSGIEKKNIIKELIDETKGMEIAFATSFLIIDSERFISPERNLGVGKKTVRKAAANISQVSYQDIREKEKEVGKLSIALGRLLTETDQKSLVSQDKESMHLWKIHSKLLDISNSSSENAKMGIIQDMFQQSPDEDIEYVSYALVGDISLGVGAKTILDAVAESYNLDKQEVRNTYYLEPHVGSLSSFIHDYGELPNYNPLDNRFKPMLASSDNISNENDFVYEPKYDGARIIIKKQDGDVRAYSRSRIDITHNLPELQELELPDCDFVVDGEVIGYNPETGENVSYQKTMTRVQRTENIEEARKEVPVEFKLFDLIVWNGIDISDKSLTARYSCLRDNFPNVVKRYKGSASSAFDRAVDEGHEGIVVKHRSGVYEFGKRSVLWRKKKPLKESIDLEVVSVKKQRKAGVDGVGALLLQTREGVTVGKVGTGFTDEDRSSLWEMHRNSELIGKIVEIEWEELQENNGNYGIRFARYIGLRDDKENADTLERIKGL